MRIVAFVPAKGTSERVPGKNRAVLDGDHLFRRKLVAALDCAGVAEVCLDTECDTLAGLAEDLPVARLKRPAALASNSADGHELFAWQCRQRPDADIWVQLLCTAPFVSADTIARAIEALLADPQADSLVAVSRAKHYRWDGARPAYGEGRIPNSADLPSTVTEAMSLYMVRNPGNGQLPQRRFGKRPVLFELDPLELLDIDTPADLALAETLAAGLRAREALRFRAIAPHLSSSVLADICKEKGIAAVLPPRFRPTTGGRLMGRARTLELAALDDPPSGWEGIYGALESYRFVRQGDVIVVATGVPGRAYFGDLNAGLALRAGAVGAVIDGLTRDTAEVRRLGFPVYARGNHCDDIKYEGTLRAMNRPIAIGGVAIANDDVVFADEDGVVVVPRARWAELEAAAFDAIENEARIRISAARGDDVGDILSRFGSF
jgi:regulator of RNase E activity RraA/CMP-N-acetylneuraminic acid synthetase